MASIMFALNCCPTRANSLAPFLLQHGRWPNDPLSLALIKDDSVINTHIEYFSEMMSRVQLWRKVVKRKRKEYNRKMRKATEKFVRFTDDIRIGEFCYLYVPYLRVETKNIRRLNIPWRGPYLISDIINGRLVRLTRVEDLVELPKLYPIHRIKCTRYGLDPPKFPHIEGLTLPEEEELADMPNEDLVMDPSLRQPWDDDTLMEVGRTEQANQDENNAEVEPEMEETITQVEDEEISQPNPEANTSGPQPDLNAENHPVSSAERKPKRKQRIGFLETLYAEEPNFMLYVRLPPRIRTTRQAAASSEPSYREIQEFYDHRVDKFGNDLIKILCKDDPPNYAYWVSSESIVSFNEETSPYNVVQDFIKHHKKKSE